MRIFHLDSSKSIRLEWETASRDAHAEVGLSRASPLPIFPPPDKVAVGMFLREQPERKARNKV